MKTIVLILLVATTVSAQDLQKIRIRAKDARAISYSPDNQYFAFAIGNDIELYNAGNDTRVKNFTGTVNKVNASHSRYISNIAFSHNATMLASASADKTIKIWKVPSGDVSLTLEGHTDEVTHVEFVNNDTQLLSLSSDQFAILWDVSSGKIIYSKKVAEKAIRSMHVSPDGKYFVIGGGDKTVSVFDVATGTLKSKLDGHRDWVRTVKFSPDSKSIASGGDDKVIRVWEVESGNKLKEFPQRGWVYDVQFSQDGKYLGAALEKSSVVFYNLATGLMTLKIDDFIHPVLKLAISPGGKEASTIEEFETDIKVWNIESLNITPVFHFKDSKDTAGPLVMVSNPPNIVDNKVRIYRDIVDLRGIVTDDSGVRTLKINGKETPVRENGNFLIHLPLSMGDNFVNIEVTDVNDNISLRKFVITRKNAEGEEYNPVLAKNYLLVIGINSYQFWPKLNNAVKDVNDISSVLMSRYNFDFSNITILKDEQATRSNIYNSMRGLIEKISPQDNLVVYFSGHGFFDDLLNEGYWIPVDAHVNSTGEYISNTEILKVLGSINSQHTFLVADACFSGALFADAHRGYTENVEKFRSRWGLTSGRLEVVSDGAVGTNSPFAQRFLEFLTNNQKAKFPVSELIQYVKTQVAEDNHQTPIGNPLKALGDEGGEFVFHMKN
jgi:WD40 repeat protein